MLPRNLVSSSLPDFLVKPPITLSTQRQGAIAQSPQKLNHKSSQKQHSHVKSHNYGNTYRNQDLRNTQDLQGSSIRYSNYLPTQTTPQTNVQTDKPGEISIKITELPTPEPGPGEVLVRITVSPSPSPLTHYLN